MVIGGRNRFDLHAMKEKASNRYNYIYVCMYVNDIYNMMMEPIQCYFTCAADEVRCSASREVKVRIDWSTASSDRSFRRHTTRI